MRAALKRFTVGLVTIAASATLAASPATASDDLPRTPGTVADSVMVSGSVTAHGYTGSIFHRQRHSNRYTLHNAMPFGLDDSPALLTSTAGCAGSHAFEMFSEVFGRREDGAVRVLAIVWTWDSCDRNGHHGSWGQRIVWVPAGETETIELTVRARSGATVALAAFTNLWTPRIDVRALARPRHWLPEDFRFLRRFASLPIVSEHGPKSDQAATEASPTLDTSKVKDAMEPTEPITEPIVVPPPTLNALPPTASPVVPIPVEPIDIGSILEP